MRVPTIAVVLTLVIAFADGDFVIGAGHEMTAQVNVAPVPVSITVTTQEGVAVSGVLTASDANGDPLTFGVVSSPGKGTLAVTPTTGAFSYTPNGGAVGYDTFSYSVSDGLATSTASVPILIVGSAPRWLGQTARASVASNGSEANAASFYVGVPSADGRFIAFSSTATNLASGTNGINAFVHDRRTRETTLVSVASVSNRAIGGFLPALNADGRYVAFTTPASSVPGGHPSAALDAFVHDRETLETTRVSVSSNGTPGNAESVLPVLSADGRYVAFYGTSSNLVSGDTNNTEDVFIHDRTTRQTTRVSVSSGGAQGNSNSWRPTISADGRFIAFNSEASNLVSGDTNGAIDVFVHDRQTGQTSRVSVGGSGAQANDSTQGELSAGGRFVVLSSPASNLVPGDTNGAEDIFVHDRQTGQVTRVSVSSTGGQGNGQSTEGTISADGRYVAFRSLASNLVPGDTNGSADAFVHDRQTRQTIRVSVSSNGTQANDASQGDEDGCCIGPRLSDDGRSVIFASRATNLTPADTNNTDDIFVVGPVTVSPLTIAVRGEGGTSGLNVAFDYPDTPWTATTTTPWITIAPPAGGNRDGSVSFTVAPNPGAERSGTIVAALQTVTISQPVVTAPQPPTQLLASSIVGNRVTLRFTPPAVGPVPIGYVVEGGVNPGQTLGSIPTGSTTPVHTLDVPSGAFFVRIRTLTGVGLSGPSNEIRLFVNTPAPPSAPINLLSVVNGSSLTLTWQNTASGGPPTSMLLDVTGTFAASIPLPVSESVTFPSVTEGTYTLAVRAANAVATSEPSNAVTVTIPGGCTGPPLPPVNFAIMRSGVRLSLSWDLAPTGPAPTSYLLNVTGTIVGTFPVVGRSIASDVPPGTYYLTVAAVNACGSSPPSSVQTVRMPSSEPSVTGRGLVSFSGRWVLSYSGEYEGGDRFWLRIHGESSREIIRLRRAVTRDLAPAGEWQLEFLLDIEGNFEPLCSDPGVVCAPATVEVLDVDANEFIIRLQNGRAEDTIELRLRRGF